MNMTNEEKIIRDAYEKIDTPEYDAAKDVLRRLHSTPRKNLALKRVIIAAAVVCLCAAAVGAVKLIDWQSFNLFGERTGDENMPLPTAGAMFQDPFSEYDGQFTSEAALGESRIVVLEDGSGSSSGTGHYKSDDFDAIAAYVNNAGSPLPLPAYVPEGYVFIWGKVEFYLDVESLKSELVSSEVKDGKLYEVYKLPEGYDKKIEWVRLEYVGPGGSKLTCESHLGYALDENTSFSHGAPESAAADKIEISGFDEAILIHDAEKANFYLNIAVLYKEIPEVNAVFSLASALHPSENIPYFSEEAYVHNFSAILSTIEAESLSGEEVIKIAESLN